MKFHVGDRVQVLPKQPKYAQYVHGRTKLKRELAKSGKILKVTCVSPSGKRAYTDAGDPVPNYTGPGRTGKYCSFRPTELKLANRKILIFK